MNYLKGIFYALSGRIDVDTYNCRPLETEIDLEEFSQRIDSDYSEVLSVLAE